LLARAEKLEAGSACERAEQRCKELEIDLSASDSTAQQLRLEVARLQDSAMSLEAELLLARAEKLEAGSACERAEQRCKELEIDLNSADSTAQQLKQEVARQQDSVDALSRSLEEARAERIDLLAAAHDMEGRCRQLADESVVLRDALAQGKDQISYWHERVLQLHASTSWRVTKPLRFIKRLLSRNRPNIGEIGVAPQNSKPPYRWSQAALAHSIRYVFVRPRVQRALSRAIKKFPGLHSRLREFGISSGAVPSPYVAATNMNAIRSTSTSEGRATATPRLVQVEHMIQQDAAEPDLTESVLDDSAVARVRERLWGAGQ
ncbi:hypothetical protein OPU71_19690, partial [Niveibacterium sp. 24ML]|uniref:hypothetical protein n=1 Tax=Niveibacterium sp. 24ML TaxID=2985512 RepID=UPI0022715718